MTTYLAIHVALGLVAWGMVLSQGDMVENGVGYRLATFAACIILGPTLLGMELGERLPPPNP